jgi:pyruvate dehydrogenase E1 component beta subunit
MPDDAKALLKASIRDDNPVLFLEHEGLYNFEAEAPDEIGVGTIGEALVRREGADITLVAYGGMTHVALEAARRLEDDKVDAEVVDLRTLRPWDEATVMASVAKTHHAVVVEECPPRCGIAAEVAVNIYEQVFDRLDGPVVRVSGSDTPMPYARALEQACIPHGDDVAEAARRALNV